MTKQESFKTRVRARMAKTGERYVEARRILLEQSTRTGPRPWVSEPEMSDAAVEAATGKDWEAWCVIIDGFADRSEGHATIAARILDEYEVSGWWAQSITVGYERITGLRLPHQMADGTFTANKSRIIDVDAVALRRLLLRDEDRRDLFPAVTTQLKSKPSTKRIRLEVGPGEAVISLDEQQPGRTRVTIAHRQLPTFDAVEEWKFYWSDWLDAVANASEVAGSN